MSEIDIQITPQLLKDMGVWLGNEQVIPQELLDRLDDEQQRLNLISLLNTHWLTGAFTIKLKQHNAFEALDVEIKAYLEHLDLFYLQRNQNIKKEVIYACRVLTKADIPVMVIKGATGLFNGTFKPLSTRFMTDVDLLVPEHLQTKAIQALLNNGYWLEQDEMDVAAVNHHHAPPLARDNQGLCCIEVHQWPIKKHHQAILSTKNTWLHAQKLTLTDELEVLQMSATDQVILSVAHCELSHRAFEHKQLDWRQLLNTMSLINRYNQSINWHDVESSFACAGQKHVLDAHLHIIEHFFATTTPINSNTKHAQEHIQSSIDLLCDKQGRISPWQTLATVLKGYSKESIDVIYGADSYWSLTKGRLRHAARHLKMLSKPQYLTDFINRLRN
ncbi:hypothetical protein E2K93_01615 [Thalassotalea sp. HSM 43]|uniref:nucleotidyltransferase family protein n=1 Tax=Thalassotalea sp. HSM 43 TaxID=2552945 RepID=UPI0010819E46|nr:nucleotidyltransferase family protein [Thalassotalea sp. HSM 43]QBY03145.1 hypothetical protein E2K93_01615 [Thalassotalea sp. HSM 43]